MGKGFSTIEVHRVESKVMFAAWRRPAAPKE
jgi:hypothetical protein